ncbi:IclR family transcriptional regulator [Salinisphaera sp. USBA-960]|nr:IclR family transcriptional regulator [Salifodinibacter halophilus]NNC26507.1 IclR family transcriptional regulator [Salifodinibacter halophilus]
MEAETKLRGRGRPRSTKGQPEHTRAQTVDRALVVFQAVAAEVAATLTVISSVADLPYSTTHRILETLRGRGLVHFDEDKQTWSIGVEAFRIGQSYARRVNYLELGREAMQALTDEIGETSNIAVRDGAEVVFVSQIQTHAPIRAFFPPGSIGLLRVSGIGKAILAHLDAQTSRELISAHETPAYTDHTITDDNALLAELEAIRARGWGVDDEERHPGMRCIAAPIFNEFGEAVAGISVSGPVQRLTAEAIEVAGPEVKKKADWITEQTGGRPGLVKS